MRQGLAVMALAAPALAALALAGCSDGGPSREAAVSAGLEMAEAEADMTKAGPAGAAPEPGSGQIAVSLPRIAYVYDYGYRLPAAAIAPLQMRHADLCEAQGPDVCRILDMRQSGMEGEYAGGSLTLSVAAPQARGFGAKLAELADGAGGEQVSSAIRGEDLSKQIVNTEARLRARTVLRDRLMDILATRRGTVAELVEAERGVARVNEEIDQAESWLAEMKGRVEFSRVNITYSSGVRAGGGFAAPIRAALGNVGSILGMTIAAIITALSALLPLALLGLLAWWGVAAIRRRRRAIATVPEEPGTPIGTPPAEPD